MHPKDMPRIDQLVDTSSNHEPLTFINAFSSYNQIWMVPKDEKKTTFLTDRGLFCYKIIGLKNVRATYQWLVNKIFKD